MVVLVLLRAQARGCRYRSGGWRCLLCGRASGRLPGRRCSTPQTDPPLRSLAQHLCCLHITLSHTPLPPRSLPADIRYVPYQTAWVNGLQASFFASLAWASLVIILNAFIYPKQTVPLFTILLWAGGRAGGRGRKWGGGFWEGAWGEGCGSPVEPRHRAGLPPKPEHECSATTTPPLTAAVFACPDLPRPATPAGILPNVGLAWCMLWWRYRHVHRVAQRYRDALTTKQPVIHKFFDELEVEVGAGGRGGRG